jgi:hypothetical protein
VLAIKLVDAEVDEWNAQLGQGAGDLDAEGTRAAEIVGLVETVNSGMLAGAERTLENWKRLTCDRKQRPCWNLLL